MRFTNRLRKDYKPVKFPNKYCYAATETNYMVEHTGVSFVKWHYVVYVCTQSGQL